MDNKPGISDYNPAVDISSRSTGLGGSGASTYTIFNGVNNQGGNPLLPPNVDNQGLTFFTRPCMNLSYNNTKNIRKFAGLGLSSGDLTAASNEAGVKDNMGNVIRCTLMPVAFDPDGKSGRSPIVDDKSPFIALLTNSLLTLSGWPDFAPDTYTSNEGISKEVVSWIDGKPNIYEAFDMTANFVNMEGDPITDLFHIWTEYGTRVLEGSMIPFPFNMAENRVDYQTRIFRLILDKSRKFVQNISSTIAYPTAAPIGAKFNYSNETPLTDEAGQVSVPFRCLGATYDDPILRTEFNRTVELTSPEMHVSNRETLMQKLSDTEKAMFNYKAYPYISDENELEWWVEKPVYDNVKKLLGASEGVELRDAVTSDVQSFAGGISNANDIA